MTRKNFPIVNLGSKKFFVSQRGLIDREPLPIDRPPNEAEVLTAMRALSHYERSSHPTVSISDLTMAIRRRYGYLSPGSLIVAMYRLKIEMRSLSRSEVFTGVASDWVADQRRLDRSFVPTIKRSFIGPVDSDRYSHPLQPVLIPPVLGRGSLECFWADGWAVTF